MSNFIGIITQLTEFKPMAFKKHFLKPPLNEINIPKWQIWVSAFISLLFSMVFFYFLIGLRESIRVVEVSFLEFFMMPNFVPSYQIWWLSNFGMAFMALLFGQSLFIQFIFHRPKSYQVSRWKRRSLQITNDSRASFNTFLYFVFHSIAYLAIGSFDFMRAAFNIQPQLITTLSYIGLILLVLLYFHQWLNLQRAYKNTQKWMYSGFIVTILLASTMSLFYPKNIKELHNKYFNAQTDTYHVEMVKVNQAITSRHSYTDKVALLDFPKNREVSSPHFITKKSYPNILDSAAFVDYLIKEKQDEENEFYHSLREADFFFMVGKDVKMKDVEKWLKILNHQDYHRFFFYVSSGENQYYYKYGLTLFLRYCRFTEETSFEELAQTFRNDNWTDDVGLSDFIGCSFLDFEMLNHFASVDNYIVHIKEDSLYINQQAFSKNQMYQVIDKITINNSKAFFSFRVDENVIFNDFLMLIDAHRSAQMNRYEEKAKEMFNERYYDLYRNQQKKVRKEVMNFGNYYFNAEWKYIDYLMRTNQIPDRSK